MTPDPEPDRETDPRVAGIVETLDVPRQARRGFGFGIAFAVVVFAFFVLVPGSTRPAALYAVLGVVLASTTGFLATGLLVIVAAIRRTRADAPADAPRRD